MRHGNPKPCLGYASRMEAARALQGSGLTPSEIAAHIGGSYSSVTSLLYKARLQSGTRDVSIPCDTLDSLQEDAEARGVTVDTLVRRLLAHIAEDGIVDAVLDDGGCS